MPALGVTFVHFEAVTSNPLLIALFGGYLLGIEMLFCIRGGSTADKFEILAVLTTQKIGLNASKVVFAINTLLFLAAVWYFRITTSL
ncbi:MAG: uncharacterized membrane-anchored protein YitT (DUF2179 family) [Flavobacteriales bacterium]|jgi:uncharacterized membrane-anchored protein YitT (DUF2179 family)